MKELQTTETFDRNARRALADPNLREALRNATGLFGQRRTAAIGAVEDWEELRERARRIKDETLSRLDVYLEEFADNAERAGATVHWARDAAEACAVVIKIAREEKSQSVVKSKSMATEEIHLNHALEEAGLEVVETDLGEYIIQLAGETPSHIIVPAIHKNKRQIAELFHEKLGTPLGDDVADLTRAARERLRERFARAEIGISGVNFGVAETGTILILENEGNARLTTSLPKTHVAVMGIEKVIPKFADLEVFLRLLPRSGTGQKLTTYQSLITGTKRDAGDEGPERVHIVLLDNGRSPMLAHPVTRQSLACIRCGACLNACPVYQQIGGHAYGSVYPGPIGAVITPQLIGLERASQLPFASSLCGACREVCPVKIDIPEILLHLRGKITESNAGATAVSKEKPGKRFFERTLFGIYGRTMRRPRVYESASKAARFIFRRMPKNKSLERFNRKLIKFVPPLDAWTKRRDLPALGERSFRDLWESELKNDD